MYTDGNSLKVSEKSNGRRRVVMRDKKGNATRCPVSSNVIFPVGTKPSHFSSFAPIQERFLEGKTSRVEVINQVSEIGDVSFVAVTIPRKKSHCGGKKKKKELELKRRSSEAPSRNQMMKRLTCHLQVKHTF